MTLSGAYAISVMVVAIQAGGGAPVTIEVTQDVKVAVHRPEARGSLVVFRGASKPFQIRQGQRFQMIKVFAEGECRIRFENRTYDVSSCPWLPGFADHQDDIFKVVTTPKKKAAPRKRSGLLS